jgi:aminoglycoside phosphotransferase (APT) family kinase protein
VKGPSLGCRDCFASKRSRFYDLVAENVAGAVAAVQADPGPLVEALLARPSTLVHGDLKVANLGVDHDRVVMLDWGTLTTWAPPAVDFAWYLAIDAAAVGFEHDQLIADVRRAQGEGDEASLRLALLGALMQLGWEKALGATSDDAETRHRERAGLAWWTAQVLQTLDLWSPTDELQADDADDAW